MDTVLEKLKILKEHWVATLGAISLVLLIIVMVLMLSGNLDCEITSLREGVYKTCDCRGLEITIKSTESSGEKKTVCVGIIRDSKTYK